MITSLRHSFYEQSTLRAKANKSISTYYVKKIESAFGDIYSKLDMERINPDLEDYPHPIPHLKKEKPRIWGFFFVN